MPRIWLKPLLLAVCVSATGLAVDAAAATPAAGHKTAHAATHAHHRHHRHHHKARVRHRHA